MYPLRRAVPGSPVPWFPGIVRTSSVQRPAAASRLFFAVLIVGGDLDAPPIWSVSWPWSDFLDSGGKCIGKIEIIQYRLCFGALLRYGYRKGDPHPSGSEAPGLSLSTIHKFFREIFLENFLRIFEGIFFVWEVV